MFLIDYSCQQNTLQEPSHYKAKQQNGNSGQYSKNEEIIRQNIDKQEIFGNTISKGNLKISLKNVQEARIRLSGSKQIADEQVSSELPQGIASRPSGRNAFTNDQHIFGRNLVITECCDYSAQNTGAYFFYSYYDYGGGGGGRRLQQERVIKEENTYRNLLANCVCISCSCDFSYANTCPPVCNQAPTFSTGLVDQPVTAGITAYYDLPTPQDTEGNNMTLSISTPVSWATITGYRFTFSPPSTLATCDYTIEVWLNDGFQNSTHYTFLVKVTGLPNDPPIFDASLQSQTLTVGQTTNYVMPTYHDPEGDSVTLFAMSYPAFVTYSTPTFTIAPVYNTQAGSFTVQVELRDPTHNAPFSFTINVNPGPNQPPYFATTLLTSQSIAAGSTLTYVIPDCLDPDGDTCTTSVTGLPAVGSYSSRTITISPTLSQNGETYNIGVALNDGITATINSVITVTVTAGPNSLPKFAPGDLPLPGLNAQVGQTVTLVLPIPQDSNGDPITITLSSNPTFLTLNPTSRTLTCIPLAGNEGTSTFYIVIGDGIGTNTYAQTLTITPCPNTAPSFTAALGPHTTTEGLISTYTLPGIIDLEGDTISASTFRQSYTTLPAFMSYNNAIYTMNPTTGDALTYTIVVELSDGALIHSYSFVVTVQANTAPEFVTIPLVPVSLPINSILSHTLPGTYDLDGNSVSISSYLIGPITLPSFIVFTGSTYTFSPLPGDQAIYTIQAELYDGLLYSHYSFDLTVTNSAPEFVVVPMVEIVLTAAKSENINLPTAIDNEGQTITYSGSYNTGALPSFLSLSGNTFVCNPVSANIGTYIFQITLSDGYLQNTYDLTVTVNPEPNLAPYFSADLVDQTVEINQTVGYSLPSYTDINKDDILLVTAIQLLKSNLPSFITFESNKFKIAPTLPSHAGMYQIEVTLTDQVNDPVKLTFVVTVPQPPPPPPPEPPAVIIPPPAETIQKEKAAAIVKADLGEGVTLEDKPPEDVVLSFGSKKSGGKKTRAYVDKKSGLIVKIVTTIPSVPIQAKIKEVNMKGLMTVSFSNEIAIPKNYTRFNDNFLKIQVISGEEPQPGQDKSIQNWQIVDFRAFEMDIQLNFTDAMVISQSLKPDKIQVIFLANGQFIRKKDEEAIKYKYSMVAELPTQLVITSAVKQMEKAGDAAGDSMNYLLYGNLGLQVFMSVSMQLLWGMVNTLQLIIHMNMLSIIMPANVKLFFSFIVNIVNLKVFDVKGLIDDMIGLEETYGDNNISPEFQQTGYSSTNLLRNIGMLLFVLLGVIALILIVFLLRFLQERVAMQENLFNHIYSVKKIVDIISRKLFFNSLLRGFLESYLKFSISTFISIQTLKIDSRQDIINTWTSVIFILAILAFPLFSYLFLRHFKPKLENEDFKGRFESLYLNVITHKDRPILMMSLFIFRRLVYAANIVFLRGSTVTQLFVQFFCCLLMLLFFVDVKPLNQHFLNRIEIFNELTLLICSYFLFAFTDYVPDPQTRYNFGWAFIGIAVFNIMVNWAALFYKVFSAVSAVLKKQWFHYKLRQHKAKLLQFKASVYPKENVTIENSIPLKQIERPSKSNLDFQQLQSDVTDIFDNTVKQKKKSKKKSQKSKTSRILKKPKYPIFLQVNLPAPLPVSAYESKSVVPESQQNHDDLEVQEFNHDLIRTTYMKVNSGFGQQTQYGQPTLTKEEEKYLKTQPLYAQQFGNIVLRKYE